MSEMTKHSEEHDGAPVTATLASISASREFKGMLATATPE